MFNNCGPGSCMYLTRGQDFTKNLYLQWSSWEMFQLNRIVYLRNVLESKESQTRQIEWDACFNWYAEAYKSLQISKMASLKDSLQKANEK